MRIDEIDLYGNILISGFTGSEGQILTYNTGGVFDWGTASGGSSGPTSSYFKTSGYNYVICETVNNGVDPAADAIINGTNLQNAYNVAKDLDVGTKSATNRVVVLLMPGDYNLGFDSQFQLDTSFIDLVGISPNPHHTKLRGLSYATLQYTNPVDSALKNIYLIIGAVLAVDDNGGTGDGSYLRWENVILNNNIFWSGAVYGFSNIYGEFKNIKVTDSTISFASLGVIDGIFDNIEVGDNAYAFYTIGGGDIRGTYSNIETGDNTNCFISGGGISGRYENIKSGLNSPLFITNGGNISGYFENIKISEDSFFQNNSGDITGTFKNINIDGGDQHFIAYSNIDGIFDNIEIGDADYVFSLGGSGYITGTFSNIKIGNLTNYAFKNGDPISGSFKNITIGNTGDAFFSNATSLIGEFENITIGNVTNNVFKATDMISGSFKNITIGDITNNNAFYADSASGQIVGTFDEIQIGNIASGTGYFFSSGATVSGIFSNIEIGDASQWGAGGIYMFTSSSLGSITGSYKNIKVSNTSSLFRPEQGDLNGTFENIEFGLTSYVFYSQNSSILGTYSNIKSFSQQERFFISSSDLMGMFKDIEIPIVVTYAFTSGNLSGIFKNIKLGDLSSSVSPFFYSSVSDLTGTFENIEIGNGNSYDIFTSGTNISGTFSNIKIGDNFVQAFYAPGSISGYYKDITIGDLGSGRIFYGTEISVGTTIDNLYSITRIGGTTFKGRLINSTIIDSVNSWGLSIDVSVSPMPIIENCKLITNASGGYSIVPVNGGSVTDVQVLYTATNEGFDTTPGDTLISPNYNITDAGLT